MVPHDDNNGWNEWKNLVLSQLEQLREGQKESVRAMQALREDNVALKLKAGVWGFIGSSVPVITLLLVEFLKAPK